MSSSLREITEQQFAEGTTIDGDRIDVALADVILRMNNIPAKWLKRRFVQSTFVAKLFPSPHDAPTLVQDNPPFLLTRNLDAQVVGAALADGVQNEWRLKGEVINGIPFANYDNQVEGIYAWTQAHYFRKPVIITGISIRCWNPVAYSYDNDWTYHTDPPEGKISGQSLDDFFVEVSVDNPFNMEQRNLNDIELHKIRFPVNSQQMSSAMPFPPTNQLSTPVLDVTDPAIWIHMDNLCIPLHRDTRARVSIAIPQYDGGDDDVSGWEGPAETWMPWQSTIWSATLTVLEPLESE